MESSTVKKLLGINEITLDINNGRTMTLTQLEPDGIISMSISGQNGLAETIDGNEAFIFAGEMVMLINYYRNCKRGIEKSDYILPAKR